MRVVLVSLVLLSALSLVSLLVTACLAMPDESSPAPRRKPAGPPSSRRARLRARLTVCRRQGHTWRLAFPLGRLANQCCECGAVRSADVVRSHRAARA